MKIERVDDKTVKCYLSLDELEQYDVDYKDFLTRTEKAQELMREIVEQAKEKVNYQPPKLAFEMQIMMVPEQGMVLTFSEKEPIDLSDENKVDGFVKSLQTLLGRLKDYKESGSTDMMELPFLQAEAQKAAAAMSDAHDGSKGSADDSRRTKIEEPPKVEEAVFAFDSLRKVMQFAEAMPSTFRVESELYKMKDLFYLHVTKGAASYDRFSRACVQAMEFAALAAAGPGSDELLKDHGECLIDAKAIKKLRG